MCKAPSFRHPYREIGTGSPALRPVAGRAKRYLHMENAHPAGCQGRGDFRFSHMETVPAGDGKQGYAFRFDRKYPTMILPGTGRTVRFKTLGKQYTPEAIQNRILYPKPPRRAGKQSTSCQPLPYSSWRKSRPAEFPACGHSIFPTYIRWGRCPRSPGTQAMLCGRISAGWISGSNRLNSFSKTILRTGGRLRAIRQKAEDEIAVLLKERQKLYRYQPDSPQIGVLTEELKSCGIPSSCAGISKPIPLRWNSACRQQAGRTAAAGKAGTGKKEQTNPKS